MTKKLLYPIVSLTLVLSSIGAVHAKSLYLIGDVNTPTTGIHAYNLLPGTPYIQWQTFTSIPNYALGAVGLSIDTDSATLFVTYETSNLIQLLDATTMQPLGSTTAPGASD